jgi:hypothetical protein
VMEVNRLPNAIISYKPRDRNVQRWPQKRCSPLMLNRLWPNPHMQKNNTGHPWRQP